MKCEAIGCASEQDRQCRGLCFVCFTKRRFAGEEEEAKWDREHRKPKEIVIDVEVPAVVIDKLWNVPLRKDGLPPCPTAFFNGGRLVLKPRKEMP